MKLKDKLTAYEPILPENINVLFRTPDLKINEINFLSEI